MLVKLGAYQFCDGTLGGGVALSGLNVTIDNVIDFQIPIGDAPELFNRECQSCEVTFTVRRTWPSVAIAEIFILELDQNLPAVGTVYVTPQGATPWTIPDGRLLDHSLVEQKGATTTHSYRIAGGPPTE